MRAVLGVRVFIVRRERLAQNLRNKPSHADIAARRYCTITVLIIFIIDIYDCNKPDTAGNAELI